MFFKTIVEKKLNLFFTRLFSEVKLRAYKIKKSFVSLCCRFAGGNKTIIQKRGKTITKKSLLGKSKVMENITRKFLIGKLKFIQNSLTSKFKGILDYNMLLSKKYIYQECKLF